MEQEGRAGRGGQRDLGSGTQHWLSPDWPRGLISLSGSPPVPFLSRGNDPPPHEGYKDDVKTTPTAAVRTAPRETRGAGRAVAPSGKGGEQVLASGREAGFRKRGYEDRIRRTPEGSSRLCAELWTDFIFKCGSKPVSRSGSRDIWKTQEMTAASSPRRTVCKPRCAPHAPRPSASRDPSAHT